MQIKLDLSDGIKKIKSRPDRPFRVEKLVDLGCFN